MAGDDGHDGVGLAAAADMVVDLHLGGSHGNGRRVTLDLGGLEAALRVGHLGLELLEVLLGEFFRLLELGGGSLLHGLGRVEVFHDLKDLGLDYVQQEFEAPAPKAVSEPTFSALAGISIEDGKPVLAFFHREIWDRHYLINDERRRDLALDLPARDAKKAETLLRELEYIDQRKTTLYRVLEAVLETQADYLVSGAAERRVPLTQKSLSNRLGISPRVLNRLIANKSVELPWGLEAALSVFVPSRKSLLRDQLHDLALARPELSDEGLRAAIREQHGVELSRRSITQYRKELGVGSVNRRKI